MACCRVLYDKRAVPVSAVVKFLNEVNEVVAKGAVQLVGWELNCSMRIGSFLPDCYLCPQ